MLQRILRLLFSFVNAYSMVTNPGRFLITALFTALVPYLFYLIAGVAGLIAFVIIVAFFLFRYIYRSLSSKI